MSAPEGPTVADRYLRSIALAVSAVMVGVLAFPLAAGLALVGLILEERSRDSEPFGFETFGVSQANDESGHATVLYVVAGVLFVVAVITVLVLAARSLSALRRAGKASKSGPEQFPMPASRRAAPVRRASAFPAPPMLAATPASPEANGTAGERVVVLTDNEKSKLGDVGPASGTPGWYVDPLGQAGGRWWNGTEWTGRLQG